MYVTAFSNRTDDPPDIVTVFDYGVIGLQRRQGHLVPYWNGIQAFYFNGAIVFHDPTGKSLPPFNAFNDDDANGIGFVMDYEMRCSQWLLPLA